MPAAVALTRAPRGASKASAKATTAPTTTSPTKRKRAPPPAANSDSESTPDDDGSDFDGGAAAADDDDDDGGASAVPTDPEDDGSDNDATPPAKKSKAGASSSTRSNPRPKRAAPVKANLRAANFQPLLAHKWDLDDGLDPTGWHTSEKLDGVRAIWTGSTFQSRAGNKFYAPAWFTKRFPTNITLDGELFTERGGFQECVSIVRSQNAGPRWKFKVTFQIFDVPSMGHEPFEKRIKFLEDLFGRLKIKWVSVVAHQPAKSREHVLELLEEVTKSGGEGLMLRQPGSTYIQGRSKTLLKVKKFFDADAIIRGYEEGSGKNEGLVGALKVEMLDDAGQPTGKMFKVGSGLTDAQRRTPPKIGTVIIYKYQELSNSGTPRFPTYGGERAD